MSDAKAMTIRLEPELAEQLDLVAAVLKQPVAEVVRGAIAEHIARTQADPTFQTGLREQIERAKGLLR